MWVPTQTTRCLPVRKLWTLLHRWEFKPRSHSLVTSLEGTLVLKAELESINTLT